MVYPYLSMKPLTAGLLQSAVLTATWSYAFLYTDSHQSAWCLANMVQITTMLADPFFFSGHDKQKER